MILILLIKEIIVVCNLKNKINVFRYILMMNKKYRDNFFLEGF